MAPPHAWRLMQRSSTRSCIVVMVAQDIVRRTRRVILGRPLLGWLAIVRVWAVPLVCCLGAIWNAEAPHLSMDKCVIPALSTS